MSDYLSVYVTTPTRGEAETIARAVVEEKLAACANILPGVQSVYRWQGSVQQSEECAMILKATADGFDALQARIKKLHSYQCPCIVAWPIAAGNKDYLDWIGNTSDV